MRTWRRKLTMLALLLYPLDLVRVFVESISPFRIVVVCAVFVTFLDLLSQKRLYIERKHLLYILLTVTTAIVALFISMDPGYARGAFLNEMSGIAFVAILILNFEKDDIPLLLKGFVYSQLPTVVFAIFSVRYFTNFLAFPETVRFLKVFFLQIDREQLLVSLRLMRLSLPYANSTNMSVVMAICLLIVIFGGTKLFGSKKKCVILTAIFLILMIGTQSRTGIVALAVVCLLNIMKKRDTKKLMTMVMAVIGIIAVVGYLYFAKNNQVISRLITRIGNETIANIAENRHLLVPLEGINIWVRSLKNMLIGCGYGGNQFQHTLWTYLPDNSFLNSYVTVLVQRGIGGIILISFWFYFGVKVKRVGWGEKYNVVLMAWQIVLISCIFYEIYLSPLFWVCLGIVMITAKCSDAMEAR